MLSLGEFARSVLGAPLYPYQEAIGEAIIDSVSHGRGLTFSVMLARQMGKNQLSAVIEAYLLAYNREGTIVKAAPTFTPQIINSRLRLHALLHSSPTLSERAWQSAGYILGLAPDKEQKSKLVGPRVMFFSASPQASIVGATASLLLEIDEAQDVSIDRFNRDLRPMASTTNATTVLYGTAWTDNTLLAITRESNLELERRDGMRRHFEHDWRTLATINPHYKRFVENEIERLGEEHASIRTQYRLLPISGAGHLLGEEQRLLLQGSHDWEDAPDDSSVYIAGMDVGGEARPQQATAGEITPARAHDSTVISIGKVTYNELLMPSIKIVHHYCWTGKHYLEQYAQMVAICEHWNIRSLAIDRTGLGDVLASLLAARLGEERVRPFQFSRSTKSKLTYRFLAMISSGQLKLYRREYAPAACYDECWKQLTLARQHSPAPNLLDMYVDPAEGHDDYLISLALCCHAADRTPAVVETQIIRPRHLYAGEGWY
ncbi:MAG: hypothetical protein IMW89_12880 [Ktedonobacteraceae bacterium]|nr:hypothetical protein [Ktedonobacteraceae bacterium]